MNGKKRTLLGGGIVILLAGLWFAQDALQARASQDNEIPRFEVDPFWPKPLPNAWRLGSAIGVWVDDQDIVWMIHRGSATLGDNERALEFDPPQGECCRGAPPVLAFDQEGNLVHSWGGPGAGYDWPESNHGIFVDHLGNVWIGGNGQNDSHILKFTKDGRFLAQFGRPGARQGSAGPDGQATFARNSTDPQSFGRVAKVTVDAATNEVYLADGYLNRRVAVLDANTGEMKRMWSAYGNAPDDSYEPPGPQGEDDQNSPQQFRGPVHCADVATDGLVYVCDRGANRIQVFNRDGTFVKEAFFAPNTLRSGSAWDVAFSSDPAQRYLYVIDGVNERVRIIDRLSLREIANFGGGGHQAGQFYGAHSIATDSRGNIYTTETYEGKRIQRFLNRGTMQAMTLDLGVAWPGGTN